MSATSMEPTTFGNWEFPMAAAAINHGEIACINAAGYLTPGAVATGLIAVGIAKKSVDNSAGDAGDLSCPVMTSIDGSGGRRTFPMSNGAGGDAVDQADVGKDCWVLSANSVSGTSNGGTRSRAGKVWGFNADGTVEVEFDLAPFEVADLQAQIDALDAADIAFADASYTATDVEAALVEVRELADAAPAYQAGTATLVAGTVTVNSGITVAANSRVIPIGIEAITGSTNFGSLRELKASRVNGAPGVGTIVLEAVGADGAKDVDAAGAIDFVILTPQA